MARRSAFGKVEKAGSLPARERDDQTSYERDIYEAGRADERSKKDAQPKAPPRAGAGRRSTQTRVPGIRTARRGKRLLGLGAGADPRRVLLLEMAGVGIVVTVDQLAHGDMPTPRAYVAVFAVFLILSLVSELGGRGASKVATGFGALLLVAVTVANAPGIARAIGVASGQRAKRTEGVG